VERRDGKHGQKKKIKCLSDPTETRRIRKSKLSGVGVVAGPSNDVDRLVRDGLTMIATAGLVGRVQQVRDRELKTAEETERGTALLSKVSVGGVESDMSRKLKLLECKDTIAGKSLHSAEDSASRFITSGLDSGRGEATRIRKDVLGRNVQERAIGLKVHNKSNIDFGIAQGIGRNLSCETRTTGTENSNINSTDLTTVAGVLGAADERRIEARAFGTGKNGGANSTRDHA